MALNIMSCTAWIVLLMPLLVNCMHSGDMSTRRIDIDSTASDVGAGNKQKHPYTSPTNLFIQERASKQLPGPGQHFSFGALKPWDEIHDKYIKDGRKLLLVVRHGQAVSNFLGDTLGPDEWFHLEETCSYTDPDNTTWGIFDADLTALGADQAKALNSQLDEAGWFATLTGKKPTFAVVSPLSRCLETATHTLHGLKLEGVKVEEYVRETLGEDTCDARRSVSDPEPSQWADAAADDEGSEEEDADDDEDKVGGRRLLAGGSADQTKQRKEEAKAKLPAKGAKAVKQEGKKQEGAEEQVAGEDSEEQAMDDDEAMEKGKKRHHHHHHHHHHEKPVPPCEFEQGLQSKFPDFQFEVLGEDKTGLGLISDADTLWEEDDREKQKHQVKRAKKFLDALFAEVKQEVVVVVTHSGFTRSLLLAVGREPYRPVNAELVPVIVEQNKHVDRD